MYFKITLAASMVFSPDTHTIQFTELYNTSGCAPSGHIWGGGGGGDEFNSITKFYIFYYFEVRDIFWESIFYVGRGGLFF